MTRAPAFDYGWMERRGDDSWARYRQSRPLGNYGDFFFNDQAQHSSIGARSLRWSPQEEDLSRSSILVAQRCCCLDCRALKRELFRFKTHSVAIRFERIQPYCLPNTLTIRTTFPEFYRSPQRGCLDSQAKEQCLFDPLVRPY
jgi:hypothetical protein